LRLKWRPESESAEVAEFEDSIQGLDLIPLAIQCDKASFGEHNGDDAHVNVFSDLERALIHFAVDTSNPGIDINARRKEEDTRVTVATLLALKIRKQT
jgi:hypothetical protein